MCLPLASNWLIQNWLVYSFVAAAIFHHNFADQNQLILFMSDIAVAGGLLLSYLHGAGAWSFDTRSPDSNPLDTDLPSRMRR